MRILLEISKESLNPDGLLFYLGDMNFLVFGAWFFLFSIVLAIVASLVTQKPTNEKVLNLTFSTITPEEKANNRNSYNRIDILISILVVIVVIWVMLFFNGK